MSKTPVSGKCVTSPLEKSTPSNESAAAQSSQAKFVLSVGAQVFMELSGEDLEGALRAGRDFIEKHLDLPFHFIVPSLGKPLEVMLADSEPELFQEVVPGEDWTSPDRIEIPVGRDDGLEGGVRHLSDSERKIVTEAWMLWNARERIQVLSRLLARGDEMVRRDFRELAEQIVLLEVKRGSEISAMGLSRPFAPAGYRHRDIEFGSDFDSD